MLCSYVNLAKIIKSQIISKILNVKFYYSFGLMIKSLKGNKPKQGSPKTKSF